MALLQCHLVIVIEMEEELSKEEACIGLLTNDSNAADKGLSLTHKILEKVSSIVLGKQSKLYLGNLSAQKDWIHEKEYSEAMQIALQYGYSKEGVIATGITTTVRDFVKLCFAELGVEVEFCGKADYERGVIIDKDECRLEELGIDADQIKMGETVVKVDAQYYQPIKENILDVEFFESRKIMKFESKYTLDSMISDMLLITLKLLKN